MRKYFLILYIFFPSVLWAQLITPEGKFLQDSMKVGERIAYVLTVTYPEDQTIIFPDSSYNFDPFELADKTYATTTTSEGYSYDSVIYYLHSFDLDPLQTLSLPVFIVENDSSTVFAQADTIFLDDVSVDPNEPLKETTAYKEVEFAFNYPYLITGVIIFICLVVAVLLLFGKQIRRRIKLYRLKKDHEKFMTSYEELLANLNSSGTKTSAEKSLNFWKRYMEKLEKIPYTKLTTKEIGYLNQNIDFQNALKSMDKNIYGKFLTEEVRKNMTYLKEVANRKYEEKVEEVNTNE